MVLLGQQDEGLFNGFDGGRVDRRVGVSEEGRKETPELARHQDLALGSGVTNGLGLKI
jgi:hypothetical protein